MAGKKFRFSLESVLRLRIYEKECAREDLAAAVRARQRQEDVIRAARERLATVTRITPVGAVSRDTLRRLEGHRQDAQHHLEDQLRRLKQLRDQEEVARIELMKKRAEEESMRSLREQEMQHFVKEQESTEAKFLDEQAITQYHRQRRAANE